MNARLNRPPGRFKAVFLDIGGTLLTMGEPEGAYCEILARYGYDVSPEDVKKLMREAREASLSLPAGRLEDHTVIAANERARRDAMVRILLDRLGVTTSVEECFHGIQQSWIGTQVFHQYPETLTVLHELKRRGFILGAVSNWESRLEALCTSHGIAQYLDFVLASEVEGFAKPNPALFERALALAGVEPHEAAHVGDSFREDVETAASLGINTVYVNRKPERAIDYSPTVPTLEHLPNLVSAEAWIRGTVQPVDSRAEAAMVSVQPQSDTDHAALDQLRRRNGGRGEISVTLEGSLRGTLLLDAVRPEGGVLVAAEADPFETLGLSEGQQLTLIVPCEGFFL